MTVVVAYVPTDTGVLALNEAVREAKDLGVPVMLLNVVGTAGFSKLTAAEDIDLDAVSTRLDAQGVEHSVRQIESHDAVGQVILEVAAQENAQLIVVGLKRKSPVGKAFLGSTAQTVILGASCPVLTVRAASEA